MSKHKCDLNPDCANNFDEDNCKSTVRHDASDTRKQPRAWSWTWPPETEIFEVEVHPVGPGTTTQTQGCHALRVVRRYFCGVHATLDKMHHHWVVYKNSI